MSEKYRRSGIEKAANSDRMHLINTMNQLGAPPPYSSHPTSSAASSSNEKPLPSPPTATTAFENLDWKPSSLELLTAAECIAHLKLLHAFAKLRHEVGNSDGLFGIDFDVFEDANETAAGPSEANSGGGIHQPQGIHGQGSSASAVEAGSPLTKEQEITALAEQIREKRWSIFVTKAVDRFEKWWGSLPSNASGFPSTLRTSDFDGSSSDPFPRRFPDIGEGLHGQMTHRLPPLDILMVWHAHMLNPRAYLEDCMRWSKQMLWRTSFPWKLIYNSIDSATFDYQPPQSAKDEFAKTFMMAWDATTDHRPKDIRCPRCSTYVSTPYTRFPMSSNSQVIKAYLSGDTGYVGQAFQQSCHSCNLIITHEKLRVGKFIADASALEINSRPLPGTILNSNGMPQLTEKNKKIGTHDAFFPNRVIQTLDEFKPRQLRKTVDTLSVETLKSMFQNVMASTTRVKLINSDQHKPEFLAKESKIAVRKMLSHYWDNSSPFGLDLVGAVIRQGTFVQKMRKIDWLHSPSAVATMQRLIIKYHRFVRLIADNPRKVAVPTLDVDLAWHTHQLTPKVYYRYTVAETRKFLNHDDKIPESDLNKSFQWTSAAYEKKYGQPYSECACWYCECTREPLRSSFSNRVNPFRSSCDVSEVSEKGLPKDPVLGPHISTHNALAMENMSSAQQKRREFEEMDLQYAKVCKRYQKKKKASETPSRDNDAYIYSAYGYPMYYPVYVPYYAEPTCDGNRYSNAAGAGGGGCAAGTCSAGASMGSCSGGSGTPGCKASCGGHGDASGGCGSCGGDGGDGGGCGGCGG